MILARPQSTLLLLLFLLRTFSSLAASLWIRRTFANRAVFFDLHSLGRGLKERVKMIILQATKHFFCEV